MIEIADEVVSKFKKLFRKHYEVDYADEQAWEAAYNFYGFFDLLLEIDRKQKQNAKIEKANKKRNCRT